MASRFLGYILIAAAIVVVAGIFYRNSLKSEVPLVYTPTQLLEATWLNYKTEYVEANTYRTIDTSRNSITTSEGQSYTMLRAVWMGDKTTFDGAWKWTQDNIQHTGDHLFAWEWGETASGTYGVLTADNGQNSASDADTDIALALVFAYGRWQDPAYLSAARAIADDIWNDEVVEVQGKPYMSADNVEKTSKSAWAVIDPSYFNPAAYRIFAQIDPSHPWDELVTDSYALLQESMASNLGSSSSVGLPPDWFEINKTTGALQAVPISSDDTNFGYDAMRVPFNLALDYAWFKDPRDVTVLADMSFLQKQWQQNGAIASIYAHDGTAVTANEDAAIYGGVIGYFMLADTADTADVYNRKLLFLYNPGANAWKIPLSYYDDNWAWFGIALYNGLLPNLIENLPASAFSQSS